MQRSTVHYTTPRIMLALYQDGVYRPINYDIVELPFVNETFGLSHKEMLRPREFMLITRDNLVRRRRGVRFALPTWLGYPNHSTYMPADYRSHPPPAELVSISVWETVIAISPEIEIDIYAARLVLEFDEQGVK